MFSDMLPDIDNSEDDEILFIYLSKKK